MIIRNTARQRNIMAYFVPILFLMTFMVASDSVQADSEAPDKNNCQVLTADRVFDGLIVRNESAILIEGQLIKQIGPRAELIGICSLETHLGDATILPGFIESHSHIVQVQIPTDILLRHGITTAIDLGGPLQRTSGGIGEMRLLSAGPVLQAKNGYPSIVFGDGHDGLQHSTMSISSVEEAKQAVQELAKGGAVIIKIALEPGGEDGAPWMMHSTKSDSIQSWPILPLKIVEAIVDEAHVLNLRTIAHVGENTGVRLALDAGVDEWAHIPCAIVDEALLERASSQGVKVVTTIDILSYCPGAHRNTRLLYDFGATLIYGSEIAHGDVPWGINSEELEKLIRITGMSTLEALRLATSVPGENLNTIYGLGSLKPGAPADLIATRGNALEQLKLLEYPDLVISGGKVVYSRND